MCVSCWQVSDHFTPAYLAAMASAVAAFEAGYPSERLQHEAPVAPAPCSEGPSARGGVTARNYLASADEGVIGHAKAA